MTEIAGIADFSIASSGVELAQIHALKLDRSDVFAAEGGAGAVPEPGSLAPPGRGIAALFVKPRGWTD